MQIQDITSGIIAYNPSADLSVVEKAYKFAEDAHRHHKRISGEPLISHQLSTAALLAELKLETKSIAAALLYNVPNYTGITLAKIKDEFGKEIASLIEGVNQLTSIKYHDRKERDVEKVRKMFMANVNDIRALIIKLASKVHDMETLQFLPKEEQVRIAQNTLDIYAPLAYKLGIANIKWRLEDLSFKYLMPELYEEFKQKFGRKRSEREREIKRISSIILAELGSRQISAKIEGRPKHFYSIYKKIINKHRSFEDLCDIIGIRVIADNVADCYRTLGLIHKLWKPITGEFDDYIAVPKANLYQSLHTAVIGKDGRPIEFQIRTKEMHNIAEYGIAAHWGYKDAKGDSKFDRKLNWLKQILDWQMSKGTALVDSLKLDFFDDEIYVFTPKGKVICLPKNSTPIDFAYAVHSSIGNRCNGAIANGRIVPLRHMLKNGDIIRILTSKNAAPALDWLKIVRTNKAKNFIRKYLKEKKHLKINALNSNIHAGRQNLVTIGNGGWNSIQLAKCCSPFPGEKITAQADKENSILVHKDACSHIKNGQKQIKAEWKNNFSSNVNMIILAEDRIGLFAVVLNVFSSLGTNVDPAKAKAVGC